MNEDTLYSARGDSHASTLMPLLCDVENALKENEDPAFTLELYITAWRESVVKEMMLSGDAKEALSKFPSLDGIFRWAVMEGKPLLVEACVEQGADVHQDHHWAISYAVALGFDDLIDILISKGKADLRGAMKAWEDEPNDQLGSAPLLARLRELDQLHSPMPESAAVVPFSIDQLELAI